MAALQVVGIMLRGEAAYDEPASCIQTYKAIANVTDGRGDGMMEITDRTHDSTATDTLRGNAAGLPQRSLPQVEFLFHFPSGA